MLFCYFLFKCSVWEIVSGKATRDRMANTVATRILACFSYIPSLYRLESLQRTPQKFNIDTKNGHIQSYSKGDTFSKPSFWVSSIHVNFQGCRHLMDLSPHRFQVTTARRFQEEPVRTSTCYAMRPEKRLRPTPWHVWRKRKRGRVDEEVIGRKPCLFVVCNCFL